ncbi:DNA/RNA non-specific endonuclease [Mucilaginibacter polytrichastri]|nr:DNA/RNA non-specific endonuclease [Mucilaginibacter polytrichastri]SFT02645.1 DNA/RNA non-specific endonuclease [Mucilaginibacter polytrichastri]
MKLFKLALRHSLNVPKFEQAVHTDQLNNRKGYDPGFLSARLPLPLIASTDMDKVASVLKNAGPNGDKVLDYTHFSVSFNKDARLPFFSAVNMYGKTNLLGMVHDERGSDSWYADERIITGENTLQYGNADYLHSGLAKGHLVRYYDPAWGTAEEQKIAIGDTFHYTNCCPQIPYFNGIVWNYLEDYCAARNIFQDNKITLFSGPIFNKAQYINGLLVPMNFWKILVFENAGNLKALGFLMSQEPYLDNLKTQKGPLLEILKTVKPTLTRAAIERLFQKKELLAAQIKISLIEEKTGLRFGLNDADDYKGKSQYAARTINKPLNRVLKFEEFRQQMDTFEWGTFLRGL